MRHLVSKHKQRRQGQLSLCIYAKCRRSCLGRCNFRTTRQNLFDINTMHKQALALPLERPADAVDSRFTKALATHSAPRLRIADRCDTDTTRLWLPKSCAGTEIHQDGHSRHLCNSTSPTSEGSETNKLCTCLARSRSRHMLGEADSRKRSGVASVGGQLATGIPPSRPSHASAGVRFNVVLHFVDGHFLLQRDFLLQLVCPPTAEPTRPNPPSTPPPLPCPAPPHGVRPLKSVRPSSEEEDSNATPKYQQE